MSGIVNDRKAGGEELRILLAGNSEIVVFRFRSEIIQELVGRGYEVYVTFPKSEFGDGVTSAKKYGCKYIETHISRHGTNPLEDIGLISQYTKLLGKLKPDIILTFTIKPNIYMSLAAKKYGIPVIINVSGLGTAVEEPGLLQKITLGLYRQSTKADQTVFFQNKENEYFFASRHIADGKRKLLPGSGVNLEKFQLLPYPEDNQIHFLFISRVMKEKGIDQYIDAAKAIRKKYPNTVFHVLGICEEDYKEKLETLTKEGVIKYEGLVSNITDFQKISSCTIHPSYYPEGLSNVLLESCASGRPIITTDRSGCREVIDDGVNGFIVKRQDSNDLVRVIEKFLKLSTKERKAMGIAGREKVKKEFDRKIVVQKYMNEIETAIGMPQEES